VARLWRMIETRLALVLLLALAGCAVEPQKPAEKPPEKLRLARVSFADLAGWQDDNVGEALPAFQRSCARIAKLEPNRDMGADGVAGNVAAWRQACGALAETPPGDHAAARRAFESAFLPYRAYNHETATGLFTGYYEPELKGARQADPRFPVPIYGRPPELVSVELGAFRESLKGQRIAGRVVEGRLEPYAKRGDIEGGALAGRGLEIAWVDDPVDAFFLQVQGSGRIRLADGDLMRVGYAAQNGHPYVAIGRELIQRGVLTRETVSMQTIRAWLAANPGEAAALMAVNPSYVFFRELTGEGPIGAEGVPLTPGRSLAVDRRFVPLGVPVWLDAEHPLRPGERLRRLMLAQDTGGAITGPVRGDFFWGSGEEAAAAAGVMKSAGEYYLLLPRGISVTVHLIQ
jgi:membrane-bound lytic murein transglycosylase A